MNTEPTDSERFWEDLYASVSPVTTVPSPNATLVDLVESLGLTPGAALELGCGNGGDALWLAGKGWNVTTTDASRTAIRRVAERAHDLGLGHRVRGVAGDLASAVPQGCFDLVFACFFHSPIEADRDAIIREASRTVADTGVLLAVDHASVAPWSWNQDAVFPTPEVTVAGFALDGRWEPLVIASRNREATSPDRSTTATVTDNIMVLRRAQ